MKYLPSSLALLVVLTGCGRSAPTGEELEASSLDSTYVLDREHLFMVFWSGMSPYEYSDVARFHVPDSTFRYVSSSDGSGFSPQGQFLMLDYVAEMTPNFSDREDGGRSLSSIDVRYPAFSPDEVSDVYDLFREKYGPPDESLPMGPSSAMRREWQSYCARAIEGTFNEEDKTLHAFGPRYDCSDAPEPVAVVTGPSVWRDGDRVISMTAEAEWASPEEDYDRFRGLTIRYTTQTDLDTRAARSQAEQEAAETANAAHEEERRTHRRSALESI